MALAVFAASAAAQTNDARAVVKRAKAEAGAIPAQAEALARLAWPEEGRSDPQVAALARAELIDFGMHGLKALRSATLRVDPVFSADVIAALIQVRRRAPDSVQAEYVPTLQDVLWLGSPDASRIAIPELALYGYGPALMACVDAAIEHPGLRKLVVRSLGDFRDPRARFYLQEVLLQGPAALRPLAAESLAKIGGQAMLPLHDAALSTDPEIRLHAIRALVPASGIDDLTTLYDYLGRFPDDDETLRGEVQSRCEMLEAALEQRMDLDSASPSPFD